MQASDDFFNRYRKTIDDRSVWFFMGYQVARMLLPATALLSVPAADVLIRFWRRFQIVRYPIGLIVAYSADPMISPDWMMLRSWFTPILPPAWGARGFFGNRPQNPRPFL